MRYTALILFFLFSIGCGGHAENDGHDHSAHLDPNSSNSAVDHGSMDHSSMDHSKMESSPGASEAPYELQFIDTMIAHHQGAIDMARLAKGRTENKQMLTFAEGIINAQEREIAEMRRWRANWFDGKPPAINMDLPGMREGMGEMDLKKLGGLKGTEFDLEFIRQMIPHHEGAVKMAAALKAGKEFGDLRKLAETIKKDQTGEITQMRKWQAEWNKGT